MKLGRCVAASEIEVQFENRCGTTTVGTDNHNPNHSSMPYTHHTSHDNTITEGVARAQLDSTILV